VKATARSGGARKRCMRNSQQKDCPTGLRERTHVSLANGRAQE
jgi:hypothetical protein